MVKAYLRYEFTNGFGVITSNANILWDAAGQCVIASALENVAVWNVKQGSQVRALLPTHVCFISGICCFPAVLSMATPVALRLLMVAAPHSSLLTPRRAALGPAGPDTEARAGALPIRRSGRGHNHGRLPQWQPTGSGVL